MYLPARVLIEQRLPELVRYEPTSDRTSEAAESTRGNASDEPAAHRSDQVEERSTNISASYGSCSKAGGCSDGGSLEWGLGEELSCVESASEQGIFRGKVPAEAEIGEI